MWGTQPNKETHLFSATHLCVVNWSQLRTWCTARASNRNKQEMRRSSTITDFLYSGHFSFSLNSLMHIFILWSSARKYLLLINIWRSTEALEAHSQIKNLSHFSQLTYVRYIAHSYAQGSPQEQATELGKKWEEGGIIFDLPCSLTRFLFGQLNIPHVGSTCWFRSTSWELWEDTSPSLCVKITQVWSSTDVMLII